MVAEVDRRSTGRAATARSRRHLHPQFREAPCLVKLELVAAHVRGEVHLQHDVRVVVLAHGHRRRPDDVRPLRVQIHRLIRLHDSLGVLLRRRHHQVHGAEGGDPLAAHQRDALGEPGQHLRRQLVVRAWALAHFERRLGGAVPELDAALVAVLELPCRQAEAPVHAAVEMQLRKGRPVIGLHGPAIGSLLHCGIRRGVCLRLFLLWSSVLSAHVSFVEIVWARDGGGFARRWQRLFSKINWIVHICTIPMPLGGTPPGTGHAARTTTKAGFAALLAAPVAAAASDAPRATRNGLGKGLS